MSGGTPGSRGRRRRRISLVAAVAAMLVLGAAVVVTNVAARSAASGAAPPPTTPAATASVVRTDLVERTEVAATVGHGAATTLTGRRPGTVTWLPAPGTVVGRGEQLYRVDDVPVPLLLGSTPLYRPLTEGVPAGADVTMLQENLVALGFPLEVDGRFGRATARAVAAWQERLGAPDTGAVQPGDAVVQPAPVRVRSVSAQLGDRADTALLTHTGTARAATASIDAAQQAAFAPGTAVTVTGSGAEYAGTVAGLAPEADDAGGGPGGPGGDGGAPALLAVVTFDDQEAAAPLLDGSSVTIVVDRARRDGVLAVPVGALVALLEGGYAIELVQDGSRRLTPVRTGMFADGLVEVEGEGLAEGQTVVVAS